MNANMISKAFEGREGPFSKQPFEDSDGGTAYAIVDAAERPVLFFKARDLNMLTVILMTANIGFSLSGKLEAAE